MKKTMSLFLAVLAIGLTACQDEPRLLTPKEYEDRRKKEPAKQAFHVAYRYTENGRLKAILTADHVVEIVEKKENETVTEAEKNVKIIFYNDRGQQESYLTANKATVYNQKKYAIATGNVIVKNIQNEHMETEKLFWYRDKNRISTPEFVRIFTREEIWRGYGMESNTEFTDYQINKLSGKMKIKD